MKRPNRKSDDRGYSLLRSCSAVIAGDTDDKRRQKDDDIQLVELRQHSQQQRPHHHQQQQQSSNAASPACFVVMETAPTLEGHAVRSPEWGGQGAFANSSSDSEHRVNDILVEQTSPTGAPSAHVQGVSLVGQTGKSFCRKRRNLKTFGSHNSGFESVSTDDGDDDAEDERETLLKRCKTSELEDNNYDVRQGSCGSNCSSSRTLLQERPHDESLPHQDHHHHHHCHHHDHHHRRHQFHHPDQLNDNPNFHHPYYHHPLYSRNTEKETALGDKQTSLGEQQRISKPLRPPQPQQPQQPIRPQPPMRLLEPSHLHCSIDMTGKSRTTPPVKQQSVSLLDRPCDNKSRQRRSGSAAFLASTFLSPALSRHSEEAFIPNSICEANETSATIKGAATATPTTNRLGFRLGKRKMLTDKRRFVSNCCLACAMFGIAGMILETELTMARVYDKSSIYSYMVKTSVTASTIVLLNLILAYYRLQAQLYIVNNSLDDWKIALSWPVVFQATTELVVCSIHPFPGDMRFTWYSVGITYDSNADEDDDDDDGDGKGIFNGVAYDLGYHSDEGRLDTDGDDDDEGDDDGGPNRHHPQYGEDGEEVEKRRKRSSSSTSVVNNKQGVEASVDLLFTFPMFLRFYLVGRVMLLQSRILTDASAVSIGALNRISFNVRFVLKALMTICPGTVLVVFMMTVWILTSWTLRVCESYHDAKHRNFLNSLWMIAITFLSVGYGDIVPNTYCGRSVAVFTGIMGSGCTALVVAVFARKMELTRAEKHVHNFMIDNQLSKKLKHAAANVLRETWFIYKYTSLSSKLDPFKIRCHQSKFLQAIHNLRDIRSKLRTLNDNANTMMDVSRHLTHSALNATPTVYSSQSPAIYQQLQVQLSQAITDLYDRQLSTEKRTSGIESTITWMQNRLEALPNLVMEQLSVDQLMDLNCDLDWNVQSSLDSEALLANGNFSSTSVPVYSINEI